ncbi:hypothetical protein DAPPUDRAFT_306286 [Daphnia pulex]|uniref:Lipocalin/cytosolic fatty-acid binding domain-containing protein n=1 Tax=Daphnia pulex TaxID=6669 RepID=E9GWI4_DAPPU|nr:hypothetical protein DAPPUDRAFT_306286 [Daphnia pulex]|eukprot:EFX76183.1 hypothetical protein DAPPUDRAFT_306286 [Daphnia pulex]
MAKNLSALMLLAAVLTVEIPSFVLGQIVIPGDCPKYPTQPSFNPAQFITTRWYEISRYPSTFEDDTRCSLIDIRPSKQGALKMSFKGISNIDNAVTIAAGNAYFDYGELSKFLVQMPIVSWNATVDIRFWIIATDYTNYALAWSCDPLCTGYRREQLWLLGKQKTLSDTVMNTVTSKFFTNGPFKASNLVPVVQKDCPSIV